MHEVASSIVTAVPVTNLLCSSNKVANIITIVEKEQMSIEMGGRYQGLRGVLCESSWDMEICIGNVLVNRQTHLSMSHIGPKLLVLDELTIFRKVLLGVCCEILRLNWDEVLISVEVWHRGQGGVNHPATIDIEGIGLAICATLQGELQHRTETQKMKKSSQR